MWLVLHQIHARIVLLQLIAILVTSSHAGPFRHRRSAQDDSMTNIVHTTGSTIGSQASELNNHASAVMELVLQNVARLKNHAERTRLERLVTRFKALVDEMQAQPSIQKSESLPTDVQRQETDWRKMGQPEDFASIENDEQLVRQAWQRQEELEQLPPIKLQQQNTIQDGDELPKESPQTKSLPHPDDQALSIRLLKKLNEEPHSETEATSKNEFSSGRVERLENVKIPSATRLWTNTDARVKADLNADDVLPEDGNVDDGDIDDEEIDDDDDDDDDDEDDDEADDLEDDDLVKELQMELGPSTTPKPQRTMGGWYPDFQAASARLLPHVIPLKRAEETEFYENAANHQPDAPASSPTNAVVALKNQNKEQREVNGSHFVNNNGNNNYDFSAISEDKPKDSFDNIRQGTGHALDAQQIEDDVQLLNTVINNLQQVKDVLRRVQKFPLAA